MRRSASHVDIMMNTCGCIFWYWKFSRELTIKTLWGHTCWKFKIIMWIDNQGMHCYQLNNSIINKTLKVGGCIGLLLPRSVWSPLSQNHTMMTSWHGNARHITGFVRGTTGYDGFPPQRVNNTQLWCFLYITLNILLNKCQIAGDLRGHAALWCHYNDFENLLYLYIFFIISVYFLPGVL